MSGYEMSRVLTWARDLCLADSTIAGLVSTGVYVRQVEEGATYPHLRLTDMASVDITAIGPVRTHVIGTVQVAAIGESLALANLQTLMDAVDALLQDKRATSGSLRLSVLRERVYTLQQDAVGGVTYSGLAANYRVWAEPV